MSDFGAAVKLTRAECLTYNCATATDLSHVRSLLFAPGSDERKLAQGARVRGRRRRRRPRGRGRAEREGRGRARRAARSSPRPPAPAPLRLVRVNGVGTPFHADDMAAVAAIAPDAIVLPKATPEAVDALGADGPPVVAIVETAQGVRLAYEIASRPRVAALQIGAVDLGAEVGLEPRPDGLELLYVRSKVVLDSVAAGLRSPFDVVHLDIAAGDGARGGVPAGALARLPRQGVHPPVAGAGREPRVRAERGRARLGAKGARGLRGGGTPRAAACFALDGAMVDLPVVERARRLLAETERR